MKAVLGAAFVLLSLRGVDAGAQVPNAEAEIRELARQLEQQTRQLQAQQKQLEDQSRRVQELERKLLQAQQPTAATPETKPATQKAQAPQKPQPTQQQAVGRAPETPLESRAAEIPALVDIRGVLTPRGTFVLEPSLQYVHSSNNRVALVGFTIIPAITIGLIDIRSVNRDLFTAQIAARYGVTNRFEVEARIPYVYRHDSNLTRPLATPSTADSVFEASGQGLGDIELAARYQINQPGPHQPYYVANLRFKSRTGKDPFDVDIDPETNLQSELPTGTGFLAFQPSLTVIYPSDPAVFFGNFSYTWQKKRNVGQGFGTVDPGDSVGASVGMGLALNDRASFSIGYEHNTVLRTKQNREPLIDSRTLQIGTLNLGASYRLTNRTMLNLSLNFGVTEEAPDVQAVLRMPMSF
jgi:hypothetical protein